MECIESSKVYVYMGTNLQDVGSKDNGVVGQWYIYTGTTVILYTPCKL